MSKMMVHVWHSHEGQIVAVGRPVKTARHTLVPASAPGHSVLAIEIEESAVPTLHQTHAVDISRRALVERRRK
jgi:hypothetical protein